MSSTIIEAGNGKEKLHYRTVRDSIGARKAELAIAILLIATYFLFRFGLLPGSTTVVVLLGVIVGIWLAFRPSEWAVEGIESLSGHFGTTTYIAGMLSSLGSNLPEAAISGLAAYRGFVGNDPNLRTIAILSVLIAAGFNMLLLGLTIVISTRKKDDMAVPEEAIKKDSVLIRWTIVALVAMFALGIADMISNPGETLYFPWEASLILFISYILYAGDLTRGEEVQNAEKAIPHHGRRSAIILCLIGFAGIFFAGEILTSSVETLLHEYQMEIAEFVNPVTFGALILGAAGALPEHGIAIVAAVKGKIGIAVGNLMGGVLQILLLVMGGIGIVVPIPMNRYVMFQIIVIAGSLWFLKQAITDDHKLDTFEGLMIILLQAYVFSLLIWGTPIGYG
ncbi:MAG: sodium:calcium antiporter [Promethearchaeota archaeon]